MKYTPHTPRDLEQMLRALGKSAIADLFAHIPEDLLFEGDLPLPPALTEPQLVSHVTALAEENRRLVVFAGAGAYDVYSPAAVDFILSRPEFFTAYTPYQAEASQGTLQVLYEFQSLIARLTLMDVVQGSVYDGPTALAEAVLMALRIQKGKRNRVLLPQSLHPHAKAVVKTYLSGQDVTVEEIPYLPYTGQMDEVWIRNHLGQDVAAVVMQTPNFFGVLENPYTFQREVHRAGAVVITYFDPVSVALVAPPGEYKADIAVAEGQSLGLPLGFGGPYIGILATRKEYIRQLPGRIAGKTVDVEGRPGYVTVLQTREQHIRREKATSNICTNQQLMALAVAVYLSLLGPKGLREVAENAHRKAMALIRRLEDENIAHRVFRAPVFREFVVELRRPAREVVALGVERGILPGVAMDRWGYPENWLMIAVTERRTPEEIEALVQFLKDARG